MEEYTLTDHPELTDTFWSDAVLYQEDLVAVLGEKEALIELVRAHRLTSRVEAAKDHPGAEEAPF